ncbi:MAG: SDR family NAD(P)-dependent oxidoreductase [Alkalilacustris sp.]
MRLDLSGRGFLVTGAAQGIGAACARALAEAGAQVLATDLDAAGLGALEGVAGIACAPCDLTDRRAVQALVAGAPFVPVGLVAAAGGVRGQVGGPLEAVTAEGWQAIQAANVEATLWCAQALVPGMKAAGWGRVVTISSGAGLRPSLTGIQAYCAAKHALVGLTKQLALELGPHGITVNSVAPGFVRSNPTTEAQWRALGPEGQAALLRATHMRRTGQAEDIAPAVVFLASEQAGWITGQVLSVDGGRA